MEIVNQRFISALISSFIIETIWIFGSQCFYPVVLPFKSFFPFYYTHFAINVAAAFKYFKISSIWIENEDITQSFRKCLIRYLQPDFAVRWILIRLCSGRAECYKYYM